MFKKGLVKKVAVLAMMGIMSLSLVACGDEKEEKTTTEATTEMTTTEATEADLEVSEDNSAAEDSLVVSEDGTATFAGLSFVVPEGYESGASSSTANTVTFVNKTDAASFVIAVDNANAMTEEAAIEGFDAKILSVFGEQCTSSEVSYNNYTGTEWVTDAAGGTYDGRSLVIYDGSTLIYVEFVTYYGTLDAYTELAESISF